MHVLALCWFMLLLEALVPTEQTRADSKALIGQRVTSATRLLFIVCRVATVNTSPPKHGRNRIARSSPFSTNSWCMYILIAWFYWKLYYVYDYRSEKTERKMSRKLSFTVIKLQLQPRRGAAMCREKLSNGKIPIMLQNRFISMGHDS